MPKDAASPAAVSQICKDNMRLDIINIYPKLPKGSQQEVQREIAARLCHIFKKYV